MRVLFWVCSGHIEDFCGFSSLVAVCSEVMVGGSEYFENLISFRFWLQALFDSKVFF